MTLAAQIANQLLEADFDAKKELLGSVGNAAVFSNLQAKGWEYVPGSDALKERMVREIETPAGNRIRVFVFPEGYSKNDTKMARRWMISIMNDQSSGTPYYHYASIPKVPYTYIEQAAEDVVDVLEVATFPISKDTEGRRPISDRKMARIVSNAISDIFQTAQRWRQEMARDSAMESVKDEIMGSNWSDDPGELLHRMGFTEIDRKVRPHEYFKKIRLENPVPHSEDIVQIYRSNQRYYSTRLTADEHTHAHFVGIQVEMTHEYSLDAAGSIRALEDDPSNPKYWKWNIRAGFSTEREESLVGAQISRIVFGNKNTGPVTTRLDAAIRALESAVHQVDALALQDQFRFFTKVDRLWGRQSNRIVRRRR